MYLCIEHKYKWSLSKMVMYLYPGKHFVAKKYLILEVQYFFWLLYLIYYARVAHK